MEWYDVVKAASIFMGIQLLILMILMIRQRSYWLAILAYIMVAWFFRQFFWGIDWLFVLKVIFVGGYQELFIPPVIYILIISLVRKGSWRSSLAYLSPVIFLFLIYVIWRLLFYNSFSEIRNSFFLTYMILMVLLNLIFLAMSIRALRKIRKQLISRAFNKYVLLLLIFLPHQIFSPILSLIGTAERYGIDFLINISAAINWEPYQFVAYMMYFVQGVFLVVVILSELTAFKKLQLPRKLQKEDWALYDQRDIRRELKESGVFRDPNLSVEVAAKSLGLTKKAFSVHLQSLSITFNDLINTIRVDDFKGHLSEQEYQKYDLISIAKMSGFSSKATFNRVFKEKEGLTPSEYKKRMEGKKV